MMASGVHVMEKPIPLQNHQQQQQQQQHQPHESLKCPRCDSSNTKFCYYNNYSLSQPRHFCKACKRYWTRGGTLRNVPVGGGCRKNKRVKRPITTTVHAANNTNPTPNPNPHPNPNNPSQLPSSTTTSNGNSNHHLNPLFYGLLPQNPNNYPRSDTRVSSGHDQTLVSGYHDLLQPHMNVPGLGFSSLGSFVGNHGHNSNLSFSNYNSSMYGDHHGSTSSSTSAPTMASLLASSLSHQQQRFAGFAPYDGGSSMVKDLKMEETPNRMEWNNNNFHGHDKDDHQIEGGVVSSDPNSLLWDSDGGGWLDQTTTNIGSSVPSLI